MSSKHVLSIMTMTLRGKFRNFAVLCWIFAFPILFVIANSIPNAKVLYLILPGLLAFATSVVIFSTAENFAYQKKSGTVERIFTTPLSAKNFFLGSLFGELIIISFQTAIMLVLSYGLLYPNLHDFGYLFLILFTLVLLAIPCVGIGLILASLINPEAAGGIAFLVIVPMGYISGSFIPFFENFCLFFPTFYASKIILGLQWGVSLTENMVVLSMPINSLINLNGLFSINLQIGIPYWAGFLILGTFGVVFIIIGTILMKKRFKA